MKSQLVGNKIKVGCTNSNPSIIVEYCYATSMCHYMMWRSYQCFYGIYRRCFTMPTNTMLLDLDGDQMVFKCATIF